MKEQVWFSVVGCMLDIFGHGVLVCAVTGMFSYSIGVSAVLSSAYPATTHSWCRSQYEWNNVSFPPTTRSRRAGSAQWRDQNNPPMTRGHLQNRS